MAEYTEEVVGAFNVTTNSCVEESGSMLVTGVGGVLVFRVTSFSPDDSGNGTIKDVLSDLGVTFDV